MLIPNSGVLQIPCDESSYSVIGFDPTTMLPDEDVYKPKKKPVNKTQGLETFMEKKD